MGPFGAFAMLESPIESPIDSVSAMQLRIFAASLGLAFGKLYGTPRGVSTYQLIDRLSGDDKLAAHANAWLNRDFASLGEARAAALELLKQLLADCLPADPHPLKGVNSIGEHRTRRAVELLQEMLREERHTRPGWEPKLFESVFGFRIRGKPKAEGHAPRGATQLWKTHIRV